MLLAQREMEGANALGPAHPSITLLDDNAVAARKPEYDGYWCIAASEATLSGGGGADGGCGGGASSSSSSCCCWTSSHLRDCREPACAAAAAAARGQLVLRIICR